MLDVATLPYNVLKSMVTHGGASATPFMDELRRREAKAAQAEGQAQGQGAGAGRGSYEGYDPAAAAAALQAIPQRPSAAPAGAQRPPVPAGAQQRPPAEAAQAPASQAPGQPTTADLRAAIMGQLGMGGAPAGGAQAPAATAPQPGLAQAGADVKALAASMGLGTPAGAEERQLIEQMRARHAQQEQERARMGLKAVLGGFSRGYGGAAASEAEFKQRAYAEDMQHQKQMYDLINAINSGNRKEAEGIFNKAMGLGESREKEAGATDRARLQSLTQTYAAELQAGSSKYNADLHYKAALAQAKLAADRGDRADKAQAVQALRSVETGVIQEIGKLQGSFKKEDRAEVDRLRGYLNNIRDQLTKLSGVEGMPSATGTSGTAPTGTRPPLSSFQR